MVTRTVSAPSLNPNPPGRTPQSKRSQKGLQLVASCKIAEIPLVPEAFTRQARVDPDPVFLAKVVDEGVRVLAETLLDPHDNNICKHAEFHASAQPVVVKGAEGVLSEFNELGIRDPRLTHPTDGIHRSWLSRCQPIVMPIHHYDLAGFGKKPLLLAEMNKR